MFRLETFGGLSVIDAGGAVVSTQRRRLALLALIAAAGRRGISRDRVVACLWPESSTANARHALEQLLYALRRQLDASLLLGADPLRLDPNVITSDVAEFDETFDRGDVAAAIALYRGPFLDGFYLGDAGEFERWAETERARLTQRYATGLEQLARQAGEAGNPLAAAEYWRRLVALDPVSSHRTLGLMSALADAGERAAAIRYGHAYEALARADGVEPTPAISTLLRQLVADESQHDESVQRAPPSEIPHAPTGAVSAVPMRRRWRIAVAASVAGIAILLLARRGISSGSHVVIGTGDAATDVPALQAAVDRGGDVELEGHFSLAAPPTKPIDPLLASAWYPPAAEILISMSVNIHGRRDAQGDMATIESGTIPLYVDAPGDSVTIRGLRFDHPTHTAILVRAVGGLEISDSRIEGLVPLSNGAAGIAINTRGHVPLPASLGTPETVSGHLLIAQNVIDGTGGTAQAPTAGILVFSVGTPDRKVDLDIVGNTISNTTAPTLFVHHVHGGVRIVGNKFRTSPENVGDIDAVRLVNADTILMANNDVVCQWPNAAGIQIYSPFVEWPTERVIVVDNTVHMLPAPGAALGDFSAGISIRGYARGNFVRSNTIDGRGRAALSLYTFRGGIPAQNVFSDNHLEGFQAAMTNAFVGNGVASGQIVGANSVSGQRTPAMQKR